MNPRYFKLEEARALLPELKHLLSQANTQLAMQCLRLEEANKRYLEAEQELDDCQAPDKEDGTSLTKFREQRARFEKAIELLSREQNEYLRNLESWVDKISKHGVILRKISEGLIDFPAKEGSFEYFLCWQANEADISHWHAPGDGFMGRRKLSSLLEYALSEAEE